MAENQNPEQQARNTIDALLRQAGWVVQHAKKIDLNVGLGQAVREYQTDVGPADYVLFVDKKAVGVIEAKREEEGQRLTAHETQTEGYAAARLKWVNNKEPLPFLYESTGIITRFTDGRDPKPRSREMFCFHRPETLKEWLSQGDSLRERLQHMPILNPDKLPANELSLRDCQEITIVNLEESFKDDRPRSLVQMATGSGKTYAAITSIYRLLKHAKAARILFLVDTKNLGEQAEQEMMSYVPIDDNRKFTELYNVQRLKSSFVAKDSQVCISTIQRLYSILKDTPLDEAAEEINPAEMKQPKTPMPVVYNEKVPPEFFDFIFIDECHRSIYNLWQQVIDYFDASLIGLTATPDNRTYGFFKKNVVSDYSHEKAVADGVNVGNEIYVIETEITQQGAQINAHQQIERREKLTRKKRWEQQDEDEAYSATQLDRNIVNPDQIRTVIRTFREKLPEIFPGRKEVPKTLIFAKTDSHADDIIQAVREEYGEGNAFCKKLTYKIEEDPKSVLADFRNAEELFSELDKGIENLKTARAQLKVYRQALLKHAFEGKLTAQWRKENQDKLETADALLKRIQQERAQCYQQQLADWEATGKQGSKPKTPKPLPPLTAEELAELPDGWIALSVENIFDIEDGDRGEHYPTKGDFYDTGYCLFLNAKNVTKRGFAFQEMSFISEQKHLELRKGALKRGDIVFTSRGTLGNIAHYNDAIKYEHVRINSGMFIIRDYDISLTPDFLYYHLNAPIITSQIEKLQSGTAQPQLPIREFKSFKFVIPSKEEQLQIVQELEAKLSEVDQLDLTISTALQQAEVLRQSILKKAFSGQLVPQDPHDEPASELLARIKAERMQHTQASKKSLSRSK